MAVASGNVHIPENSYVFSVYLYQFPFLRMFRQFRFSYSEDVRNLIHILLKVDIAERLSLNELLNMIDSSLGQRNAAMAEIL